MHRLPSSAAALLVLCGGLAACGGGGGGGTPPPSGGTVDTTDIASWSQRDAKPLMSMVTGSGPAWAFDNRLWQSSTRPLGEIPTYGAVRLGAAGREGLVVGAWGISNDVQASVPPMRLAVFEQGADGLLREATASYVDSDLTDGAGKVLVADFNGDGRDDFALPMYTETRTTAAPPSPLPRSVAFVSRPDGRYERFDLSSDANGPDMDVSTVGGVQQLFTPGGGYSLETQSWAGVPSWRWNGAGFTKRYLGPFGPSAQALSGAAVVRDFTGDGRAWIVRTNSATGPGLAKGSAMRIRGWQLLADSFDSTPVDVAAPYFDGKPAYAALQNWLDPQSKTDNFRVLALDINQDGLLDVLPVGGVWSPQLLFQGMAIQLLVNRGGMRFEDMTDAWRPEFRADTFGVPEPRAVDLDGSGIETLLLPNGAWLSVGSTVVPRSRHASYILVNDGTGRFYAAMDAEFTVLGQQVLDYVRAQGLRVDDRTQPNFVPFRRPDGKLNFLASLFAGRVGVIDPGSNQTAYVNVPLGIDITTGFKRALTVATRNGSRNIRTFAGDDTVHRALADPDCRIDGGLGTNTVVYPGRRADWVITRVDATQLSVRPAVGGGGTDTLVRVQRARFDDQTVELAGL